MSSPVTKRERVLLDRSLLAAHALAALAGGGGAPFVGASSTPQKKAIVPGRSASGRRSAARSWSIDAQVLNGCA